ncbi:MAG: hypothetical protein ACOX2Q_11020 [Dehalobacterium sp.]|jgi:hypothetical protein
MPLWVAAMLFIACVVGTIAFIRKYVRSKQVRFLALTAVTALLALALLGYTVLAFILLARAR